MAVVFVLANRCNLSFSSPCLELIFQKIPKILVEILTLLYELVQGVHFEVAENNLSFLHTHVPPMIENKIRNQVGLQICDNHFN